MDRSKFGPELERLLGDTVRIYRTEVIRRASQGRNPSPLMTHWTAGYTVGFPVLQKTDRKPITDRIGKARDAGLFDC